MVFSLNGVLALQSIVVYFLPNGLNHESDDFVKESIYCTNNMLFSHSICHNTDMSFKILIAKQEQTAVE